MAAGDIFRKTASDLQNGLATHAAQARSLRDQSNQFKQQSDELRRQSELLDTQARDLENQVEKIKQQIKDLNDDAARADQAEKLIQ